MWLDIVPSVELTNFIRNELPAICVIDKIITVSDDEAYEAGRRLARQHGLLVGISSGAAYAAAMKIAEKPEFKNKNIVVIFPDSGNRYLSTEGYY